MRFPVWLLLLACGCSSVPRASEAPPATSDAGIVDAGSIDAGIVDAGSADAGPPAPTCSETHDATSISDPRATDNACVFDLWLKALPSLTPAAQRSRVEVYLGVGAVQSNGFGNEVPIRSGPRVIFIADTSQGLPRVAGDWNGWQPANGVMQPLAQSGYAYREEMLPVGRHAYKFVSPDASVWSRDPFARWVEFDGVDTGTVGAFNSIVFTAGAALDRGLLRLMPAVHSDELGNDREVYVYLPPSALQPGSKLASLYSADGNESLSRGHFDRVTDTTLAQGQTRDVIIVFIALHDQAGRTDEYTFDTATANGPKYQEFVAQTLVPIIDGAFPTINAAAARGVIGASLGGLISAYIAWDHPEKFGLVGSQSGSFFWPEPNQEHFKGLVDGAAKKPIRFYLDNGTPGDNDQWNTNLTNSLQAKGYDFTHVVKEGDMHDWSYWAGRWPGMLQWLLPK
jgi:enterochelin esterase family protein